jgi:hypothetical protein
MKSGLFGLTVLFLIGFVFGCQEIFNDDPNDGLNKKGTVVIKLTDAPFPSEMVAEANVTIDWIKLMQSDEGEGNGEEVDSLNRLIVLEEVRTINLLELSNGVTEVLAEAEIPAGTYREIRLHIVDAEIILNDQDSTRFDLKVPSGDASGLKIKIEPALEIADGFGAEVLLDFDVSRSFVMRGNMKHGYDKIVGFIFKPVVRAVAYMETGDIFGVVKDTLGVAVEDALLTLLSGTDTVTTALSSEEGYYKMTGIPEGYYTLDCEKEGYDKQSVDSVLVETGVETEQNFELVKTETSGGGD